MFDGVTRFEPEPGLNGRRIVMQRGKVLGGSSSINMMATPASPRYDDRWAATARPDGPTPTCRPTSPE